MTNGVFDNRSSSDWHFEDWNSYKYLVNCLLSQWKLYVEIQCHFWTQQTTMDTTEGQAVFLFSDAERFTFQCQVNGSVKLRGFITVSG